MRVCVGGEGVGGVCVGWVRKKVCVRLCVRLAVVVGAGGCSNNEKLTIVSYASHS